MIDLVRFLCFAVVGSFLIGCTHYSSTRIFLEGEAVDEEDRPVPEAIVRIQTGNGLIETLTSSDGKYRFEFLEQCTVGGIGGSGRSVFAIEAFHLKTVNSSPQKLYSRVEFDLDTAMLVGASQCPQDTKKYLRIGLSRVE